LLLILIKLGGFKDKLEKQFDHLKFLYEVNSEKNDKKLQWIGENIVNVQYGIKDKIEEIKQTTISNHSDIWRLLDNIREYISTMAHIAKLR